MLVLEDLADGAPLDLEVGRDLFLLDARVVLGVHAYVVAVLGDEPPLFGPLGEREFAPAEVTADL